MKCPRCQQKNPAGQKFCGDCGSPVGGLVSRGSYADLQAEIERLRRSLDEASEQQTATADILHVMSASPTDLQAVLDTVAATAARLCDSVDAQIFQVDGTTLRIAAFYGEIPKTTSDEARPIGRGSVNGRAVVDRKTIHISDLAAESDTEYPEGKAYQKRFGHRTIMATPLLREGLPIGAITIRRMAVRPFSETEISLLETFADQAVIAIETARRFKETNEAFEQQTATSAILRVISGSPTEIQPVLDAVAASAARICEATDAVILRVEGHETRRVAHSGAIPLILPEMLRVTAGSPAGRAILECRTIHVHDAFDAGFAQEDPESAAVARHGGWRTILVVPLVREGVAIGVISVRRTEVRPFTDKQIALLQTFGDQAVIAIENVRLFKELEARNEDLTESLEQQTATAEILRIISRSQSNLQPVFATIVRSAVKLCDGLFSALYQFDGELLFPAAQYNYTPKALEEMRPIFPARPDRGRGTGRAILERAVIHIPDVQSDPEYQQQALARAIGWRSGLYIPLLREGARLESSL